MTTSSCAESAASMPFPPGTVLAGKYRVERLIGEGGMGWVVVATHLHLEQRVAVKFMRASHASDGSEAVGRFLREARAAARIQSEHVARVSDFGTLESGAPYLVMEYLEGQDLESLLRTGGAIPCELAIDYALQACEGLAEAHAVGIVHRDLKPANLFLARRGDGPVRVKLLDFGISKLASQGGAPEIAMTSTQTLMGSPLYMAPEQMRSSKNVDARADIWSMGVILYEMLAARPPFDGDTLPAVCARIMMEAPAPLGMARQGVPPALEAVILRCLEKDPQRRFPDVAALVRAIAPFGGAEAHGSAERIGRLSRVSVVSSQSEVDAKSAVRVNRAAQTSAAFTLTDGVPTSRRRAITPLAIGGGVLLAAAGVILGVTAMRAPAPATARSAAASAVHEAPAEQAPPTGTTSATANPTATVRLASPPVPTAALTAATPEAASSTPAARTKPAAASAAPLSRPKTVVIAQKPAATAGFGGRD